MKTATATDVRPALRQALAHHQAGRLAEAEALYRRVLSVQPRHFDSLHLLGVIAHQRGQNDEAVRQIDAALRLNPNVAGAYSNRGNALLALGRFKDAVASYDRAIALQPDFAGAFYNRGNALREMDRLGDALASYDRAIALTPDHSDAWDNRGAVLAALMRLDEALASFDRAIVLRSDHANAFNNRGKALVDLKRMPEAVASFDRAVAIRPDYADAYNNRGMALRDLDRHAEALESFDRALALKPDQKYLAGARLLARLHICDWRNHDADCATIVSSLAKGVASSAPFALMATPATPREQLRCAELYAADRYPPAPAPLVRHSRRAHDRIRIAYLSADFHDHATAWLMAGLFEQHDRSRFETIALSFGPAQGGAMRPRLTRSFDRFIDVRLQTDQAIAELVAKLEVDIAVDLKGFTQESRPGIFAKRPAPIQASYIGFPGTMGASYIDYVIADRFVIPEAQRDAYAEKIVYLPDSYQVNDRDRRISDCTPSRAEAGLPDRGLVLCCFNNNFKTTPDVFDVWMRLLREIDGSVLWLLQGNTAAPANLRREAEARGVSGERLIFAVRAPLDDHLARHRLADLFLDTRHYNAHTTASDALWAGLPVLTCAGETFASRVAGSLLRAVGLPELVTHSLADYEALAFRLARDPEMLAGLTQKLARNRETYPLFDTARSTRHLEAAFVTMWERHQRGEKPADFDVTAID